MPFDSLKEILVSLPELGEKLAALAVADELQALSEERATLSPDEERRWRDEFRTTLLDTVHQSHFCRYAYQKPRGYPGDYLTQEMIWLSRTHGQRLRYAGTTPSGRLINSITMNMHSAVANEERVHFVRHLILSSSGGRVASIGCGSCIELWDPLVLARRHDWDIVLLDQDAGALEAARKAIAPDGAVLHLLCENVLRFILSASDRLGQRDLVYLFGLLDYFGEASAHAIVERLWPTVALGGELVLTNAHPDNPSRLWMEYATDWYLEYKTAPTLLGLCEQLSGCEAQVVIDAVGVYQYLRLRRVS
jgi:extracellular factor (EF) 3-hydroxypalmitic acid methyl ester biosynthesis protein